MEHSMEHSIEDSIKPGCRLLHRSPCHRRTHRSAYSHTSLALGPGTSFEGTINGTFDGTFEGALEGTFEGTLDRIFEGALDRTFEGTLDRTFKGTLDRTFEGTLDRTYTHVRQVLIHAPGHVCRPYRTAMPTKMFGERGIWLFLEERLVMAYAVMAYAVMVHTS